jgi:3-methylfumaryl-CoA hydratase
MSVDLTIEELGLADQVTSELSPEHAVRVAATVDSDAQLHGGDALPALWHWAYFTPAAATAALGPDGHPRPHSERLAAFPRRMWASGKVVALGALVIGEPATRHSRIVSAKESQGRSGDLLLVVLEHRYRQGGQDAIVEDQTLVYRQAGPATDLPVGNHRPEPESGQWLERITLDTTTLFRFSAVTFNSHRIHYDQPYATSVEGYPAPVVHGPLTALLVGEAIRRNRGGELAEFEFRATAPLFADQEFTIVGGGTDPVAVHVIRNDSVEAMKATATLRP